jgi:hypothetical protein
MSTASELSQDGKNFGSKTFVVSRRCSAVRSRSDRRQSQREAAGIGPAAEIYTASIAGAVAADEKLGLHAG